MKYKGKKIWEEPLDTGDQFRKKYIAGITEYIARMNLECKNVRRQFMLPKEMRIHQEDYRAKFVDMIGLNQFMKNQQISVKKYYVGSDDICKIYRLVIYITEEIPFYSLLLIPHKAILPLPLVIAQHGGGGTPELCSDLYGKNNYNHMTQRALERGKAVLAPQLLLWSQEESETTRGHKILYDRRQIDVDLKRFGSSITAMEVYGIIKSITYVCSMDEIDKTRISMIGLSYGGYFTLYTSAADTRIKAAYCAGIFNDRDYYAWPDLCYKNSAILFQDAEIAALCAPRKLYVQIGRADNVFDYRTSLPEIERIKDYYAAFNKEDCFCFSLWDGGHTISDDDEGFNFISV